MCKCVLCKSVCVQASALKNNTKDRIKPVFCTCNILSDLVGPKIHGSINCLAGYSVSILTTEDPALSLSPPWRAQATLSLSSSLSLSPFLSIMSLLVARHVSYDALYQAAQCIVMVHMQAYVYCTTYPSIAHIKFTNLSPIFFTTTILRAA